MKLNELFDVDDELNWSRLDLFEILNSKVPITWKLNGQKLDGEFEVDGSTYVIELEPGTYEKYSLINVAFYKIGKDGKASYELSLDTKNPAKVLGAIVNGVQSKIDEFHYDALLFAASNNVDKRMKFYNGLANRFKKQFAIVMTDVKTKNGLFTILISSTVPKTEIDSFVEFASNNINK